MEDRVREETAKAMTLLAPGPHGILLLVPVNQFTEVSPRLTFQLFYVEGGGRFFGNSHS